jgi:hypothetical protein
MYEIIEITLLLSVFFFGGGGRCTFIFHRDSVISWNSGTDLS